MDVFIQRQPVPQFNELDSSLCASMEILFKTYGSKDETKMQNNMKRV